MTNTMMTAALTAAERGWHVFPLRPGTKRPALHGEATCPRTGECAGGHRKWEQRATTDTDRIRAAWSDAAFNIGIATGPSDLVVVDLDMPKGKGSSDAPSGAATFAALCERAGHLVPNTYRVRTASGGEHLYFTAPPGVRLTNTAGTVAPLVDTRAWGGYVVAASSTTPAASYEAVGAPVAAPLPSWLLSHPQTSPEACTGSPRGRNGAIAAIREHRPCQRGAQRHPSPTRGARSEVISCSASPGAVHRVGRPPPARG